MSLILDVTVKTGQYECLCVIMSMSMSTVDFYSASPRPPLMRYMQSVFSEQECPECRAETVTAARRIPENVWKCIPSPRASDRKSPRADHAGSGVVSIDPLHFLAGCCKMLLNQALSVCLSIGFFVCVCVLLCRLLGPLFVYRFHVCSVCWLFWLSCQYLPCDWLERIL